MKNSSEAIADVPPNLIRALVLVGRAHGVDVERLCRGLGFTLQDLEQHDILVSYTQSKKFLLRIRDALPGVLVGLESGLKQTILSLGTVGLAMYAFRTLREAIGFATQHQQRAGALATYSFEETSSHFQWVITPRYPDPDMQWHVTDEAFASIMVICRNLLGKDFRPTRVELAYPRPSNYQVYEEVFGCKVFFNTRRSTMTCPSHWLDQNLPTWHPYFSTYVLGQLAPLLEQPRGESDLVSAIRRYLQNHIAQSPGLEEVAHSLNISGRTLRRHLEGQGIRFLQLLDEVKLEHAQHLRRQGLSWGQIAEATGYNNASNFSKAYARWAGHLPRESDA